MAEAEWSEILAGMDRHRGRRHRSPDRISLPDLMDLHRVPAVSVAVTGDGVVPWAAAYGTATTSTIFQACSISKHVAAFGTLRLVDQGVLDLDEDVHTYLTSWRLPADDGWRARTTVRQLLAHTAGLSSNWFRGFHQDDQVPTLRQVLDGEPPATTPPVRATTLPGSRFRYSGSHYAVLQQVLEDVTDTPFTTLMHTLVLEPLDMRDSSYDQQFPLHHDTATGHHAEGTPLGGGWRVQPELAAAGLWTTPSDLVRLGAEIRTRALSLLTADTTEQMLTPQVPGGYGLGVHVDAAGRFGHTGGNLGYGCWTFTWPDAGATMAVMINNELADEVLMGLLDEAERRYGTSRPGAVEGSPTGTWRLRDDYRIDITETDGGLVLTSPGQPPLALHPLGRGRYRAGALDCEIRRTDRDTLELRQEDDVRTATRER
ncbi:serine hydrolase domain-containing protein [Umezawaea endophytica]|uniref:Beta-lactamase family protein n=1 Tax=Umezawaea endophytica TaxID=1654476 RepID=A0A9X2VVW3_9PSEU|nr:serine hydrolase domain-containing protein [Umezawaea endophytica]MCS7483357.1 beta-lactamase family protein [Umezawaea endophytica]